MQKLTIFKNDIFRNHLFLTDFLPLTCNNTNSSNFTKRSVSVTLYKNDLSKLNHIIDVSGQWFLNCIPQSLWGRVREERPWRLPWGEKARKSSLDGAKSLPQPLLPGKLYIRVLCNNSFEAKTNETKWNPKGINSTRPIFFLSSPEDISSLPLESEGVGEGGEREREKERSIGCHP